MNDRVLQIAELAWAVIAERNLTGTAGSEAFQHHVYESTTEFLIDLDQAFKRASDNDPKAGAS